MSILTSRAAFAVLAAGTMLQGCATVTSGWQAAAPVRDTLVVDPACLASAPWFADPAEADLQLFGCRPVADIPAADQNGWREFATADGALIRARGDTTDPRTGKVRVEVFYNGGGTLSVRSLVTGTANAKGVMKAGTFTVTPLN